MKWKNGYVLVSFFAVLFCSLALGNDESKSKLCVVNELFARLADFGEQSETQALVEQGEYLKARNLLYQKGVHSPDKLFLGLFTVDRIKEFSNVLGSVVWTAAQASHFMQTFNRNLKSSKRRTPSEAVEFAALEYVRAMDDVLNYEFPGVDPEMTRAQLRAFLVYSAFASGGETLSPSQRKQLAEIVHARTLEYLLASGERIQVVEDDSLPVFLGVNFRKKIIIEPSDAPLGILAKKWAQRKEPIQMVFSAPVNQLSTMTTINSGKSNSIFLGSLQVASKISDPQTQILLSSSLKQISREGRGDVFGIAIDSADFDHDTIVKRSSGIGVSTELDIVRSASKKLLHAETLEDRRTIIHLMTQAAARILDDSESGQKDLVIAHDGVEKARRYILGFTGDPEANVFVVAVDLPRVSALQINLEIGKEGPKFVIYFDLPSGKPIKFIQEVDGSEKSKRVVLVKPPFPRDFTDSLSAFLRWYQNKNKALVADREGRELILDFLTQLKRRMEVRQVLTKKAVSLARRIYETGLRTLLVPDSIAIQNLAKMGAGASGDDVLVTTLRNQKKRNQSRASEANQGIKDIPVVERLRKKLFEAVNNKQVSRRSEVVEEIAMHVVTLYVDYQGYRWTDVSADHLGYDIEIRRGSEGRPIQVEVKGLYNPGAGSTVELTKEEIRLAGSSADHSHFALAIVLVEPDGTSTMHLLENLDLGGPLGPAEASRRYRLDALIEHSQPVSLSQSDQVSKGMAPPVSATEALEAISDWISGGKPLQLNASVLYAFQNLWEDPDFVEWLKKLHPDAHAEIERRLKEAK